MKLTPVVIRSAAVRWALGALAGAWALAGWWIVIAGGLSLSLDKRSLHTVPLQGGAALFIALIFLALSTTTAAALLQGRPASRNWVGALLLVNIGLPLAYWLRS